MKKAIDLDKNEVSVPDDTIVRSVAVPPKSDGTADRPKHYLLTPKQQKDYDKRQEKWALGAEKREKAKKKRMLEKAMGPQADQNDYIEENGIDAWIALRKQKKVELGIE